MEDNKESKILKVMGLAIKFIGTLNDKQLDELISKEYKFDIKSKKKYGAQDNVLSTDEEKKFINIANIINKGTDREKVRKYIEDLKFTKEKLIILGGQLGIKIPKSTKKDKIISIIVEDTIGNRLKVEGLRKGIMGKSY